MYLPDFVQIKNKWYSWKYFKNVSVQSTVGRNSYNKIKNIMASCDNQNNLTSAATVHDYVKNNYFDTNLLDAHLWWRFFNVCTKLSVFCSVINAFIAGWLLLNLTELSIKS